MSFTIRQFDHHERLCDKLKALRKAANFTVGEMQEKTKIHKGLIRLLEAGAWDKLPDPIYTRNFLKGYLHALGTQDTYYLNLFEEERGTCDFVKQARLPRQRARAHRFLVASRFLKTAALVLGALSIVTYLGFQVRSIVRPPVLVIAEPSDGIVTHDATIQVTGEVEKDSQVKINGSDVLLTTSGDFDVEVALERGLNVIKIESVKRYSRPSIVYRRVVLEQDGQVSLAPRVDK
ncbi:helix-turn-helix domain-containing protein [Candidatus Uhrbacteria bacterium]|nr:helix-turn-helix domain-containing protein [Candidatus Uhrbacteria bacterium]